MYVNFTKSLKWKLSRVEMNDNHKLLLQTSVDIGLDLIDVKMSLNFCLMSSQLA